ncbi:glycosyl hydrolases family 31-domain-containing protein [Aspergillus aurantiobrunneus]
MHPTFWLWATAAFPTAALAARTPWDLGKGFELTVDDSSNWLSIAQNGRTVWDTVPGQGFLSASGGEDIITAANGNFKIEEVDQGKCSGQQITKVTQQLVHDSVTEHATVVQGHLTDCGDATVPFSVAFWVPLRLPDRIAFTARVNHGSSAAGADAATKLFLTYGSSPSEDFYGLGGQASFASLKNQSVPIFSREQGVGRGDQPTTELNNEDGFFAGGNRFTTYSAVAQYISSHARAFHLTEESTAYATFDFTDSHAVTVRYAAPSVDGYLMQAGSMLDAITMVTEYTGRMRELPRWVDSGAIVAIQGGQDKVHRVIDAGLQQSCPIAAVWLQDWSGTHEQSVSYMSLNVSRLWWNWENDRQLYPTWTSFVQTLRDDHNIRTLSYINPFLTNVSTKSTGYARNLYNEAVQGKYTIQNATTNTTSIISSGPGLAAGILDLTNNATRTWFKSVMLSQVWNANISGFMTDFGEYTPVSPDTRFADRSLDPRVYHNAYPRDWAALHHWIGDSIADQFTDSILFHRSSATSANRHQNLYWAGDQAINWGVNDGIKSSVTVMAHMGISGYAHGHTEIGGYTTTWDANGVINRTAELLGRWGELAAVSSCVFRSHEGNVPQVNAQSYSNGSTMAYFSYNARLFASLGRYRRMILDTESKELGWPVLRMPVLYHPDDPQAKAISYQSFFLGRDLYVAPVLDAGRDSVDVYFPGQGEVYTHVWSGRVYRGGQKGRVAAPYGKPAMFMVGKLDHGHLDDFLEFVKRENGTVIRV